MFVRFLHCLPFLLVAAPVFAQTPDSAIAGNWPRGEWQNSSNSHHGPLHATFTPTGDGSYRVTFGGKFAKVIPFRYTVLLQTTGSDANGNEILSGTSKVPLFGTFHYNAVATPTQISTQYRSRKYSGQFLLHR